MLRGVFINAPLAMASRAPGAPLVRTVAAVATALSVAPAAPSAAPLIPQPAPPNLRGALPVGKGMWIWLPEKTDNGDPNAIVAHAQHAGLTHLYVRTGSSVVGFNQAPFLNSLLPVAHAAGLRVFGWDFPYLDDVGGDIARASAAVHYVTPSGQRLDGFASDIELRSMGVNLTPDTATAYGNGLRGAVGPEYPLVAVVPRPSPILASYPYEAVVAQFDAIAPMIYWMNNDPMYAVDLAFDRLGKLGKPIMPIGQAYDGGAEGGPPGVPSAAMLERFMMESAGRGATGVSFWSWQAADQQAWDAIANTTMFSLPTAPSDSFRADQIRTYQVLLSSLGFGVPINGAWSPEFIAALTAFQNAAHLKVTGVIDPATRAMMLRPIAPPLR